MLTTSMLIVLMLIVLMLNVLMLTVLILTVLIVEVDHVDVDHFEVDRVAASRRPFGLLAGAPAFLEFLTFPCKPQKAAIKAARTTGKKRVW